MQYSTKFNEGYFIVSGGLKPNYRTFLRKYLYYHIGNKCSKIIDNNFGFLNEWKIATTTTQKTTTSEKYRKYVVSMCDILEDLYRLTQKKKELECLKFNGMLCCLSIRLKWKTSILVLESIICGDYSDGVANCHHICSRYEFNWYNSNAMWGGCGAFYGHKTKYFEYHYKWQSISHIEFYVASLQVESVYLQMEESHLNTLR